jgi:tRNA modification GTPase
MLADNSSIAAIATAPGRGGIGVVRLSGKQLRPLIHAVCRLDGDRELKARQATYLDFIQADGSVIDRGLAIYFSAPNSYTGEEVLAPKYDFCEMRNLNSRKIREVVQGTLREHQGWCLKLS